jgi:hypothetical protein
VSKKKRAFHPCVLIATLLVAALLFLNSTTHAAPQQLPCVQSSADTWTSIPFPAQTAQFTVTYDAIPGRTNMDGLVAFSQNPATHYTSNAVLVRFSVSGVIDARNGSTYSAERYIPYFPGGTYHFRVVIDPVAKRYSVYVTPPGSWRERRVAADYAFRSEQAATFALNNWNTLAEIGSQTVCNMAIWIAPIITSQPVSRTVMAGEPATFSVVAEGSGPITYQWKKDGVDIDGATSASYIQPATIPADDGAQFTVVASNSAGSTTSDPASLTVQTRLLSAHPPALDFVAIDLGSNATQTVTLTNSGTLDVEISDISIAGAGFSVSGVSQGQVLAPGQTATLDLSFAPAVTGRVTGGLTIASNASNSPATIALSGEAPVSHSVTVSWDRSSSDVVGYNVYRSIAPGGPYVAVTTAPVATSSYLDRDIQSNLTYYYVVTAVDSAKQESSYSNEARAVIP